MSCKRLSRIEELGLEYSADPMVFPVRRIAVFDILRALLGECSGKDLSYQETVVSTIPAMVSRLDV